MTRSKSKGRARGGRDKARVNGDRRSVRAGIVLFTVGVLLAGGGLPARTWAEEVTIPDYAAWRLEQVTSTHRPGTDLQFHPLELNIYVNPGDPSEMVVELRRHGVLYILYHYTITDGGPRWAIFMDAGFANAPCGFFDPNGRPAGSYVRIDLRCLRDTERVDMRPDR